MISEVLGNVIDINVLHDGSRGYVRTEEIESVSGTSIDIQLWIILLECLSHFLHAFGNVCNNVAHSTSIISLGLGYGCLTVPCNYQQFWA